MDNIVPNIPIQVLRLRQVCTRTGLCKSSVYQLEAENRFPKRVHLSDRCVGWLESEIQEWLSQRVSCSRRS